MFSVPSAEDIFERMPLRCIRESIFKEFPGIDSSEALPPKNTSALRDGEEIQDIMHTGMSWKISF